MAENTANAARETQVETQVLRLGHDPFMDQVFCFGCFKG